MKNENTKIFIGPMSKNIVDATIEFCNENNKVIGLIPSRRQIEFSKGYVNNWSTKEFCEYVRSKTDKILLVRDHGGPLQGNTPDYGLDSLYEDCQPNMFDVIHIDIWKKYQDYQEGFVATMFYINYCVRINENILFEVGTEEAIRPFTVEEVDKLLSDLKTYLEPRIFNKIKYIVVQSGTALKGNNNIGSYDKDRLLKMVEVANKHKIICKEHNGDYLPVTLVKEKFKLGLDCINIAPEFGNIETQFILKKMQETRPELIEEFFNICLESKRWVKWVNKDFNPIDNKLEIINICGHYVFSDVKFLRLKSFLGDIDGEIRNKIKEKLWTLA